MTRTTGSREFQGGLFVLLAVGTMVAIGSAPLFAGLMESLWFRNAPTRIWFISTALALLGCILLLGSPVRIAVQTLGVLLAAGAGLSYALYSFLMKQLLAGHRAESVAAVVFCIGALIMLPFLIGSDLSWVATARGALVVIHLGLFATALSYYLFCKGLERITVSTGVTLSLAEPCTAGILGVAVLGERLGGWGWAGLALILSGLVLLVVPMRRKANLE